MSSSSATGSPRGTLVVISAPSGTGKSTLVRRLIESEPRLVMSVSATTRAPRTGERDGLDYHFLEREAFVAKRDAGEFLEHAEVHGNLYGTLRGPVAAELAAGRDVLLEIDVQGARQVRASSAGARFIFVLPPSRKELERRLRSRGLDAEDVIARRLLNASGEVAAAMEYDHVVVNQDLAEAHAALRSILASYRQSAESMREIVRSVLETFGDGPPWAP